MGKRKQDYPQKNVAVKKYRAAAKSMLSVKKAAIAKKFGTKSERKPEVKFVDTNFQNSISFAGQVQLVNATVQGTAVSNRIGEKIEMTSISVDFQLGGATLTTGQGFPYAGGDVIRVALVYDRQANGAALTYANVFQNSGTIESPMGKRNNIYTDRFEVLKSEMYKIDSASNIFVTDSWYIPTHHDVRYNVNNNGDITDISSGSLYLVYADQGNVTTGTPLQIVGSVRVRFRDE